MGDHLAWESILKAIDTTHSLTYKPEYSAHGCPTLQ